MVRYLLLMCLLYGQIAIAQQVRPSASSEIYRQIKSLKTVPKVLYFAAHPDDENTGLLSWLVNEQHVQTAYLSLTRGDGGQNLIGNEQGAGLGLIRTYELLEARKKDGAKQYFTRAIDFGFSKNPEDTFEQWDLQQVLADAVWVIRKFKPDVIICRFPPTAAAGHGQHSASAIVAEKAVLAASDPSAFPEQLKEVDTWKVKRLLWNTYQFGSTNTINEEQFKVTTGQYDPLMGLSFGELAGISRSLHQSQGAGTPSVAGIGTEYFELVSGAPLQHSLFDGIPMTLKDVGYPKIEQLIDSILLTYDFTSPANSLNDLLRLRKEMREGNQEEVFSEKLHALNSIIIQSIGFMAELVTGSSEALAGQSLPFHLNVISRSKDPIYLKEIKAFDKILAPNKMLNFDSLYTLPIALTLPENTPITEPYWLKQKSSIPNLYSVEDQKEIGYPILPNELQAYLTLLINQKEFEVPVPLSFKKLDPIKGDVVERLRIVPPVTLSFTQELYFPKQDAHKVDFSISLHGHAPGQKGSLELFAQGKRIFRSEAMELPEYRDTTIRVSVPTEALPSTTTLNAVFQTNQYSSNKNRQLIQYPHLPVLQYFLPAESKVIVDHIKVAPVKIGYLPGAGDYVPQVLEQAGISVAIIKESDFNNVENLLQFDVIVTGVRSLNTQNKMRTWMPILNDFVFRGGTLLMQFNTLQTLSTEIFGPYPFKIGRGRVAEENSEVTFLQPDHVLFQHPNPISEVDFEGWIQERGLYFPTQWDSRYQTLLRMHDKGEENLDSGILYATYGKGHYVYTPLSFFRQLPAGHQGAIKLFFNLLSIGK